MFEDTEKNIWISSRGGPGQSGLARWDRSAGTFHHYSQEDGFPQGKAPSAFCQDQLGSIWIGFYLGGLTRRTSGRFQTFGPENGLPEGGITALYVDSAGRLWIGSQNAGLARLDDVELREPVFIPYTTRQGLSSNNVRALTEDEWGRLYIGTARGVDRLDPKTDLIRHFTAQDGLANSFVTTALRDSRGQLWFGTADGVSWFRAQSEPLRSPPPIWIAGLQVAGVAQAISLLGETAIADLVLPPDQDQIQINFSSLGFAAGERIRYQFRLEGTDQGWSDPTDQRSVNFARLAPGSYRFLVRAINSDGQVSSQPATVAFTVLAPLWRRWWVLALAGLAMASLAYVGYRYRISRLLELERVRTRIASDLHDDIGAGLSQISLQSELVKRQIESAGPGPQQMLTQIAETSRDLVDTMSDLVWSIDPRRNDIKSLTARLRQVASNLLDVREINWQLRVADPAQNLKIGPEQRRHLILIIKEALNNIVRHSGCVSASRDLKGTARELLLEIRDDGCGFSHSDSTDSDLEVQGNGLRNIRARAEDLGAELRINSSPGRGTTLKLRLPL